MSQHCFHCGLTIPAGLDLKVEIAGQAQPMCCHGCQAVAQAIVDNDLLDFYRFRTETNNRPDEIIPQQLQNMQMYDSDTLQRSFVRTTSGSVREASLILEGIVCAACVWLNERHVRQLPGVLDFRVNYSTHRARLQWDNSQIQLSDVLQAISAIGYYAHPFDPNRLESLQKKEKSAALRRIAIAGLGMMQIMMISLAIYMGEYSDMSPGIQEMLRWASLLIATPVVLYSARVFFTAAWRDLKRRQPGMDVPVALAIGAAFLASTWATFSGRGEIYFDSVTMFTFFLLSGRFLEMSARHKAGQVAEALVRLLPALATRVRGQEQETIAVSELEQGDHVLVRPGETVPADGVVLEGSSSVNESLLTGESLPRSKQTGDELIGGTLNVESPLTFRVDQLGDSTVLAAIVRLLERAQTEKPRLAQMADQVATWFVVFILLLAAAVFTGWYLYDPGHPEQAFWITLSVLVVTCPCALSLATPTALTAATGLLTEKGVLTTRGHALETLAQAELIIFDKTGTLTRGELQLEQIRTLGSADQERCLQLATGLESTTEHPIGKALARLSTVQAACTQLQSVPGSGVSGTLEGVSYRIGNQSFVAALSGQPPADKMPAAPPAGVTRVYMGSEQEWLAVFELSDQLRPEAAHAIAELKQQGIAVALLSGDAQPVADKIAAALAIPEVLGGQLPNDKLARLRDWQQAGKVVAMVGDGVNDAPVLAGAPVSVAMGSGAQLAQASADMVLLSENLDQLPFAVKTARRMRRIIRQNFAWALGYNLLALPLAIAGLIAPWMAAIGMSVSSLIVVLNALRLRR